MNSIFLLGTSRGDALGPRAPASGNGVRPIFPLPCLLVDLAYHECRAWLIGDDGHRHGPTLRLQLADFTSAIQIIASLLDRISPVEPRSIVLAIPGPALAFRADFTNSDRNVDCMAIYRRFGFENGMLLNDQEAAAFCVPDLGARDVQQIGSADLAVGAGAEALISSHHGLGVAVLRRFENRYISQASEAGHIGISPSSPEEFAVLGAVYAEIGRIQAERIVANPGLALIHRARAGLAGFDPGQADAAQVALAAAADPHGEEANSARMYCRIVGSYAGDVALALMATGGVTLSGAVLQSLRPFLASPDVRKAFETKDPMTAMLRRVPLRLALEDDLTLRGLAVLVQSPENFGINYDNRCWRQD